MEKIIANFLNQPNKDFPLDCETLDNLQQLSAISAIIGNIAGDKVVLYGCTPTKSADGKIIRRDAGWVFVRTKAYPEGEVLHWIGGSTTSGMHLSLEDSSVTVNNKNYDKAYTCRRLIEGYGDESFDWNDFTDLMTIKEIIADLESKNQSLKNDIKALQPPPVGIVQMWAGVNIPDGYLLCNGSEYRQADYPELYKTLGSTFNSSKSADGSVYTTNQGFFRVPDLRGRFIVGQHDSDNDYKTKGYAGGEKNVILTSEQLPSHSHKFKDYYFAEQRKHFEKKQGYNADNIETNGKIGSGDTDFNNEMLGYYEHNTYDTGGSQSHENRPPYYVLAYIIRAK